MKRNAILVLVFISIVLIKDISAQKSYGGEPVSFKNPEILNDLDRVIINSPDINQLKQQDEERNKNGQKFRTGVVLDVNISNLTDGAFIELQDGTKIWLLSITVEGAKALSLVYDNFYIPEGSELFLYNENRKHVLGAFNHNTNPRISNRFSTQMVEGETTYLEYIQAPHVSENPIISISGIVYNYRGVEQFVSWYSDDKNPDFGASDPCQVNVNCPEGNEWQDQKRGVALMYVIDGWSAGLCSGSLVNNTSFDGTPYFLSADHCGETETGMDVWQFYFHYEAPTCDNPATEPSYETVIGSEFRSRGLIDGGSDFILLELSATPQEIADLNLYYNGWNKSPDPSNSGVGIHHPSGDIKKISTYTNTLTTTNFWGSMNNAFWEVIWSSTTTNHGVTEQGSSGSPLFNSNKRIVGTLTGGSSFCTALTDPDQYGKFSVHWIDNGATANRQLKPWLDPEDTGETEIPGYDPNATADNPPVADFIGDPTTVVVGGTVDFTDLSSNNPTSWAWTFQNGDPPNSPAQNPSITYNTLGTHNVQLIATNAHGNDSEVKNAYITVVDEGELVANFIGNPTTVVEGGTVQFTDQSSGPPTAWEWEFEGGDPLTSNDQNPEITYNTAGVYSVTLTASDGTEENTFTRTDYITVTPPGGGDLVAAFVASNYNLTAGQCINFNDQSQGGPTTWSWSFPGATPLTSSNQNPTNICYPNPGIYDVCLMVTRGADTDTYCCEGCIIVNPDPSLPIANFEAHQTTIPVGSVVHFTNLSENGPFMEWAWTFQGGIPYQVNDSTPPPIVYFTPGEYDVELRCKNTNGMQDVELKQNYIRVIPQATEPPTANFEANYTVIEPDDKINFIDFSAGNPYIWEWEFEGATPEFSYTQNPVDIEYPSEGLYYVRLKVSNNFGESTLIKEEYILVKSETDTCTDAPIVNFTADNRLIAAGGTVGFINQSSNYPTIYNWNFPGGTPNSSQEATPTTRIKYNLPGIYPVTLTASNDCGGDILTKEQYIYVFSGGVSEYCDTLTNVKPNEGISPRAIPQIGIGWLAGQNGDNIREYACHFENYTYSHIKGLLVPVSYAIYGAHSSYVTFYIWDGNSPQPDSILASKKVFIRDLQSDQVNHIVFDQAVEINGPFYLGFKINYPDTNNDGVSDDLFVIPIVNPRVNLPEYNTMYVKRGSDWFTANERYGFSSSLTIKPLTCLVEIDEFLSEFNVSIYPNPTTGLVSINLGDIEAKNINIEIYDILGRKSEVKEYKESFGEYSIDLSDKPDGMYIIRIKTGKYVINKKLLLSK
jgi:lysyl endopeptidase